MASLRQSRHCLIMATASGSLWIIFSDPGLSGSWVDAGLMGGSVVPIRWALIHSDMVTPWSHRHQWHHIPSPESPQTELFNYLSTQTNKKSPSRLPSSEIHKKLAVFPEIRDQIGYLRCLGDKNTENKNQIWSKHQGSTHKTANTNRLGIIWNSSESSPSAKRTK